MLAEQDPHAQRKSMSQESEHDAGPFYGTVIHRGGLLVDTLVTYVGGVFSLLTRVTRQRP